MNGDTYVRLVDVTKRRGGRLVLDRVSLAVAQGEFVGLLGSSGSGKTTILRMIAGLDVPDEGQIWIAGELAAENGRNVVQPRRRNAGFVFQDLALWPHMTVRQSLTFVLHATGLPKSECPERIHRALSLARIRDLGERYPHQLSGGEQQRAALARALVTEPRLLLLDEPMSSLDADLKAQLAAELGVIQASLRVTTIYVTHDRSEIEAVITRTLALQAGRIWKPEPPVGKNQPTQAAAK